jgi:predicted nucleic acid-binding protein
MQRSSTVCVDTNIVFRLITDRDDDAVWQLWDRWRNEGRTVIAPSLLRYELTNAIYRLGRAQSFPRAEVLTLLNAGLSLEIVMHDDLDLHADAAEFAARFSQPAAYDAHFLALAARENVDFYTGDRKLWNAVRHQLPWVHLVAPEPAADE